MSTTSVAFSLSAEEDCLLLPSWSPEEQRSTTLRGKPSTLAEDQPASAWFPPENVDQRVSSHGLPAVSEETLSSSSSSSSVCSTNRAPSDAEADSVEEPRAETRPFFPAERRDGPRLLLGACCSSSSTAAPPSSHHRSRYQPATTKHRLLAV